MMRSLSRFAMVTAAVAAVAAWSLPGVRPACAQEEVGEVPEGEVVEAPESELGGAYGQCGVLCRPRRYGDPALFYNFYVPNNCGGVPAELYLAPRPAPPLVGYAYYTYQPLMPHEFLYPHHRTYRRWYNDCRGLTRTKVTWYRNPATALVKGLRQAIRLPR